MPKIDIENYNPRNSPPLVGGDRGEGESVMSMSILGIVYDASFRGPEVYSQGMLWPFLLVSLLIHLFLLGIGGLLPRTLEPIRGTIEVRMVSLVSRLPSPVTVHGSRFTVHGEESTSFKEAAPPPDPMAEDSVRHQTSASSLQPPDLGPQPPATSHQPPATSHQTLPFTIHHSPFTDNSKGASESTEAEEGLGSSAFGPNLDLRYETGDLSGLQPPASSLQPPGLAIPDSVGDGKSGGSPLAPLEEIRQRIDRAKFYPAWARRQGIEGTVVLEFLLSRNGEVGEVKILRSSGSIILDEASIETIKRAAPYPAVKGRIQLPITYRLEK